MTRTPAFPEDPLLSPNEREALLDAGIRLAITGGGGFLGSRLLAGLAGHGVPCLALDGDIRDPETFRKPFTVLLHCASPMPRHFADDAETARTATLTGTRNALAACERYGARLVLASSSAVYRIGDDASPIAEDAPLDSETPYGASKKECEDLCFAAQAAGRVGCCVLRIFNPYGHGQARSSLLGYVAERIRNDQPVEIEQPEARRDFVHVADVLRAFLLAAAAKASGPINIGTGESRSVREAVLALVERVPKPVDLKFAENPNRPATIADRRAAARQLGWRPRVAWEAGLDEVMSLRPPLT